MTSTPQYDYIIAGGGCAGLSLAVHLLRSGKYTDKKILLVEKEEKNTNDRTWCFWEKQPGIFQDIVFKEWRTVGFFSHSVSKTAATAPYVYKMIRGIDFYRYANELLNAAPNFERRKAEIKEVYGDGVGSWVELSDGERIKAFYVFTSIPADNQKTDSKTTWFLQHFKGWMVETKEDRFNDAEAVMMDFRTNQKHGTSFCYVLPLTPRKALVEYTVFSHQLLEMDAYDEGLKRYLSEVMQISAYTVTDTEFGVIPMTDHVFPSRKNNIIFLGTAGGQTKGSTGYTFNFIQKHSAQIAANLIADKALTTATGRYRFYDSVLLGVLEKGMVQGDEIFSKMFSRNPLPQIFRFLDNETTIREEIRIISTLPAAPFMRSALRKIF